MGILWCTAASKKFTFAPELASVRYQTLHRRKSPKLKSIFLSLGLGSSGHLGRRVPVMRKSCGLRGLISAIPYKFLLHGITARIHACGECALKDVQPLLMFA